MFAVFTNGLRVSSLAPDLQDEFASIEEARESMTRILDRTEGRKATTKVHSETSFSVMNSDGNEEMLFSLRQLA